MSRTRTSSVVVAVVAITIAAAPSSAGSVLLVDDDAAPGGDGQSWGTAIRHLQDALSLAVATGGAVDEIRVAQGTYMPDRDASTPTGSGSRSASFVLIDGVALNGGYAGPGRPDPDLRDVDLFETVLSGDLLENDGRPGSFLNYEDNSISVVRVSNTTALIDGFSITAGGAGNDSAGLFASGPAGPTVNACRFHYNLSGGVHLLGAAAHLTDCGFEGNRGGGAFGRGGGAFHRCWFDANEGVGLRLHADNFAVQTVVECVFTSNNGSEGGGMYVRDSGSVTISKSIFCANTAFSGAGLAVVFAADPTIIDCVFKDNIADDSGAGGAIVNGLSTQSVIVNCLFHGNEAGSGGAIYNDIHFGGVPEIINCTFVGNVATSTGGAMASNLSSPTVTNSVFWGDTPNEIADAATITYSDVMGGFAGTGNISTDPLFIDPGNGDFRPQAASPCIDSGINAEVPSGVTTDLSGSPRFVDDPDAPDCPQAPGTCGVAPIVDMGVHEFQVAACPDINGDGEVNVVDLLVMLGAWGPVPPDCPPSVPADTNGDCVVDVVDLLTMLGAWGPCTEHPTSNSLTPSASYIP